MAGERPAASLDVPRAGSADAWQLGGLGYDGLLLGLGLVAYIAACAIFWRCDLPAPL